MGKLIGLLIAAGLVTCAAPALADTGSIPPGNPCAGDNGNPCNDNNGNPGEQGNVNHDKVKIDPTPPPIILEMPAVTDRGVFVSQIGDGNRANVGQTATNAYASVDQSGDSNNARVNQAGQTAYLQAGQSGDGNSADVTQGGSGQNVAYVLQQGDGNAIRSTQLALGDVYNGARLTQTGNRNAMALDQEGSGNLAVLTQDGDDNAMTAVQLGEGNRLAWIQQGDGLSDLGITQTGGGAAGGQLLITQTNGGSGH